MWQSWVYFLSTAALLAILSVLVRLFMFYWVLSMFYWLFCPGLLGLIYPTYGISNWYGQKPNKCPYVGRSVCPSIHPSKVYRQWDFVCLIPPTVLCQSFWNFPFVFIMVWRCACPRLNAIFLRPFSRKSGSKFAALKIVWKAHINKDFALQIMQISQTMLSLKNYWWKQIYFRFWQRTFC